MAQRIRKIDGKAFDEPAGMIAWAELERFSPRIEHDGLDRVLYQEGVVIKLDMKELIWE